MQTILWSVQIFEMFSKTDWTPFHHTMVSVFSQGPHLASSKYSSVFLELFRPHGFEFMHLVRNALVLSALHFKRRV